MNFNIEEIVKPLVEKNQKKIIRKEEIIKSLNDNMLEKNKLVLELEKLQDNKEQEIEDYVNFNLLDRDSNFYPGYASVIRKDLEREYNKEIEKLNQKITDADKKEEELNQKIKELDTFSNVDLYELTDIKEEVRKNLYKKRKELEYELSKENSFSKPISFIENLGVIFTFISSPCSMLNGCPSRNSAISVTAS